MPGGRGRYDAVIFDLFGTLVGTFTVAEHERVLSAVAAALNAPREELARWWVETFDARASGVFATIGDNIESICRDLHLDPPDRAVAEAVRIRLDFTRGCLAPRADAEQTLRELRAAGYRIGLISDCSPEVPRLWAETPFAALIDAPVFSCSAGMRKPDPRIYQLACERLAVQPARCLYVGDGSSRELTGASRAGMSPILIRVPYENTYDAHRIDAEEWAGRTVSRLSEVLELLG
jgi:putative hydrolase of the HAD superfamily